MKAKALKIGAYLMQVILTALVSAIIALLQNYLASKGVNAGGTISPAETGAIGSILSSASIALKKTRIC